MVKGLVGAAVHVVVLAVGAGDPHVKAITCQEVALPALVQPKLTEVDNNEVVVKATGCWHAGGGLQVTFATQPAAVVVALDVKTKVKLPFAALEVTTGGKVVPENVPNNVPVVSVPA